MKSISFPICYSWYLHSFPSLQTFYFSNLPARPKTRLLKLNSARRLAGNVISDSAHTVDLVDDSVHDALEEVPREVEGLSRHEVRGRHRAQDDNVAVDALVAHDTHSTARINCRVRLRNLVVQAGLADLRNENVIGLAGNAHLLLRHLTQNADGNAGTGEGVAHDEFLVDAEGAAELADFVLVQGAERLDELETLAVGHALGQTADVVVGLDGGRGALEGERLDDVWVQGTLQEEADLGALAGLGGGLLDLLGLGLEHVNELAADELALLLGIVETLEALEEVLGGVDDGQVDAQVLLEVALDLLALVQAHDAVVDEHGPEAVADGLLHQLGGDGGVNTARDGAKDLALGADEVADAGNFLVEEARHGPVLGAAANVDGEVLEQLGAVLRVGDLGVELETVDGLGLVRNGGILGVVGNSDRVEALGQGAELVTVRHPHAHGVLETGEEAVDVSVVALEGLQVGVAVLAVNAGNDVLGAGAPGDLLHAICESVNDAPVPRGEGG